MAFISFAQKETRQTRGRNIVWNFSYSSQAGEEFNCLPSEMSHTWMGFVVVTEADIRLQKAVFIHHAMINLGIFL